MSFPTPAALGLLLTAGVALSTAGCSVAGPAAPDVSSSSADVELAALAGDTATSPADSARCTAAQRWAALAVVAPRVHDLLAAHPDLAAELDRDRGPAARRDALRAYVAAHPELAPDAAWARDTLRQYRATCAVS